MRGRSRLHPLSLGSSLRLFLLENEAILYSGRSRCLFGLDGAATALLLRLADGEKLENLTAGLDTAAAAATRELADILAGREPWGDEYLAEIYCPRSVPLEGCVPPCYRLLNICFTFHCVDDYLRKTMADNLRHLLVPDQTAVDLVVTVVPAESLWTLCLNGTAQGDAVPADMLLPQLYDRLNKHAYQELPYLLAVHAAVVTDGTQTIVFPGKSGSGKSTLAASLLARGYRLFSDELAVLTLNEELVPIPLGLGLKSGSWDLLGRDYPTLATTPSHVRWDGSMIRYLDAATIAFAQRTDNLRATHLCFPVFQPGGSGSLETLTPVTALRYLTEAGYQVRNLHEESVDQIVSWLLDLSCSILTYSSTNEAMELLERVLNRPSERNERGYILHG